MHTFRQTLASSVLPARPLAASLQVTQLNDAEACLVTWKRAICANYLARFDGGAQGPRGSCFGDLIQSRTEESCPGGPSPVEPVECRQVFRRPLYHVDIRSQTILRHLQICIPRVFARLSRYWSQGLRACRPRPSKCAGQRELLQFAFHCSHS